jgi:hypothetical protein
MEKLNPDLVVRDKQGRSYAEREFLEDRGYTAARVPDVQPKSGVQRTATFKF